MGSEIFSILLREKVDLFRASFTSISTEVFYDPSTKKLRHAGEYGTYRESIVRDFFKFIVPRSLDISTGFVITTENDISTQCDVLIFDSRMTPLYQEGDRQRFFPIETLYCIGEVKSTLSKDDLRRALNKLAAVKALSERIKSPTMIYPRNVPFDAVNNPYDLVPSILICQKFSFNLDDIENDLDGLYSPSILDRHKHNMILSIEDGVFCYYDDNKKSLPYPQIEGKKLKHRFTYPSNSADDNYGHFHLFASYMFMLTTNKTLLYPDVTDYIGAKLAGRSIRDQT